MRQRVTLLGFVFAVTTALVGVAAFVSANNLLFLLLAALLATFLISGFISRLGLAGLELDIVLPEQIAAHRKVIGQMVLRNGKPWMPSFSLGFSGAPDSGLSTEIYIPVLPGGAILREPVDLLFTRRGIYRENSFYLTSRFPFGFTQRRAMLRLERDILVYPCVDAQAGFEELLADVTGEIEARQRGRGHDFYRIRPYEVLESARHVDWKATAHTGELQIREFARDQDLTVSIFLDLDVSDGESEWFEHAIDCCAFLIWRLTRSDTRVRFISQQCDKRIPEEATAYTILKYLALAAPVRGLKSPSPDDDRTFQIVVSPRPARLSDAGWRADRTVTLDTLPAVGNSSNMGANASTTTRATS
jgi:uncharacterized protein (DUF58 family)